MSAKQELVREPALTDWFPADVHPVHPGVYEVRWREHDYRAFAYWNGDRFGFRCFAFSETPETPEPAQLQIAVDSAFRFRDAATTLEAHASWRGLCRQPDAPLAPDPEGLNDKRAESAEEALSAFQAATGVDRGDALWELLVDLMHWCDRNDTSFQNELERARRHYDVETEP